MRLDGDFLHPGMPPFNIVVGSGHVLVKIVPVIWWEVCINPCASEIVDPSTLGMFGTSCWMANQAVLTYLSGQMPPMLSFARMPSTLH